MSLVPDTDRIGSGMFFALIWRHVTQRTFCRSSFRGDGKLTSFLPRGLWQRFEEEDRESHKLAWLQFSALRHHSELSTLETSPGCTQHDFSRHYYRILVMRTSVNDLSRLFYFLNSQIDGFAANLGVEINIQPVLSNKSTEGQTERSLLVVDYYDQMHFCVCACVCVTAGCGPPLLSLQFVCLWEYRLAAGGFLLYIPSPELSVVTPPFLPGCHYPLHLGVVLVQSA